MPTPLAGSFNGLAFGPGTPFVVDSLRGWLSDLPEIRTTDVDKAQDQGQFVGLDLSSERVVEMELLLLGGQYAAAQQLASQYAGLTTLLDQAVAAFALGGNAELPLTVNDSLRNRLANVRCRKRKGIEDYAAQRPNARLALQFVATDPRIYDAAQAQGSTGLPVSGGGGFTFPFTFPFTFGAGQTGNQFVATNAGSFATNPVATIQGPVTNPGIQNVTLGLTVTVNITLASTDTLTVDFNARTVVLNGTASRRNALDTSSRWWSLARGDNTVKFLGTGSSGGTLLTLTWRSAWL